MTVTVTASLGLSSLNDLGTCRFWSKVMVDVEDENDFSKKTRMMVIMSIIGVMFRSLMISGSASLRANERMAFLPSSREITFGFSEPALIRGSPPQNATSGNRIFPSSPDAHGVQRRHHDVVGDVGVRVEVRLGLFRVVGSALDLHAA